MNTNLVFSFDDMASGDKATKKLTQYFSRAGASVVQSSVDPKTKRSSGISFRDMAFTFADGQTVLFSVKQSGDIFQAKLNGKPFPIKHQDDHAKAVAELAKMMDSGRAKFQKALAASAAEYPKMPGIKSAAPKLAEQLKAQETDLDAKIEAATQERDALKTGSVLTSSPAR